MKKDKVFIGIPAFEAQVHTDLVGVIFMWAHKFKIDLLFCNGATPLHAARNVIVEAFLKTNCSHLFFIDDDVIPPEPTLGKLLEADKDIIMPATLMIKPIGPDAMLPCPQSMKKVEGTEAYKPFYGEGVAEVDTIGGAAFLVKREVFESEPYKFHFTYYDNGARKKGADVCFSEDMKKRGYKLYADFDLACRHVRQVDLLKVHNALNLISEREKIK